jgi:endonuclease/exonuclease/phosphatase family metal-dependent hydrolase
LLLQNAAPARYCQPVRVLPPDGAAFHLLAVWAMAQKDARLSYIAQVNFGLMAYQRFIQAAPAVILGDFNSNQRSDRIQRLGYHGLVVRSLADLDLISAYHFFYRQKHGQETIPTFYHGRKKQRPFHIDYIFVPRRWLPRLRQVSLGRPEDWLSLSDHCPVMVETAGQP